MNFIKVKSKDQLQHVLSLLPKTVSLDCETDSLNTREANLKAIVIGTVDTAFSIEPSFIHQLHLLKEKNLILHNFKYDFAVLKKHGLDLYNSVFLDTMLMHHLIDEREEHSLEYIVSSLFGDFYKEIFWKKYKSYEEASEQDKLEYECKDAIYTYRIAKIFKDKLSLKSGLINHVHRLARNLALTEYEGVNIDLPFIMKSIPELEKQIITLQDSLRPSVDKECTQWEELKWQEEKDKRKTDKGKLGVKRPEFNFFSAQQVQWLLYTALDLPIIRKTKAGAPSVDYDTLEELEDKHTVVKTLKDYKGLKNLFGTFVLGIIERQSNGKIYPSFNVNGTKTGRISHSDPNLGNMPKDGIFRGFFIPKEGYYLFGADYEQLEVNVEANLTKDKSLIRIVNEGLSKHDITSEEVGLPRDLAKTLNFAMQYHCGPGKVAKILGITTQEGKEIYTKYWEVYSGVKELKAKTDLLVQQGKPIVNVFGRERHFDNRFNNEFERSKVQRQAYNALIQGTGADITHIGFCRANEWIRREGHGRMLWSIHDELLGECKKEVVNLCKEKLTIAMTNIGKEIEFEYPLKAKSYGGLDRWEKA